jgi:hypothetical protein
VDVFHGLDEMGLSEDEIRRVRLVDPDRSELHDRLLAPAMDECRRFLINDFRQDRKLFTGIRRMVADNLSRLGSPRSRAPIRTSVAIWDAITSANAHLQAKTHRPDDGDKQPLGRNLSTWLLGLTKAN